MSDGAGAVYGVRMRAALLGPTGAPLVGVSNSIVTDSLVRVAWTPVVRDAPEVEQLNARGGTCWIARGRPSYTRYTIEIAVCSPVPEFEDILVGADTTSDGAAINGMQAPPLGEVEDRRISVEAWSEAWAGESPATVNPYFHWAFPLVRNMVYSGTRAIENGAMASVYTGEMYENAAWGDGPANDYTEDSTRAWQFMRTATVPAASDTYVAVAADAP